MNLPVLPPVAPMLGRVVRSLPRGDLAYEPKWDGFRCLAFRSDEDVDLRSRHDRPLARYFPEVVEGLRTLASRGFVLDGELVVMTGTGPDFAALMSRLHPAASRVARLREETPAAFIAFDLLAEGDEDLRPAPFSARRERLEALLQDAAPPILLTPATRDPEVAAAWLAASPSLGGDGVIAKEREAPYQPGKRTLAKVKRERTADCVVAGFRVYADQPLVASLLLGLYGDDGALRHVGVASSFGDQARAELLRELFPLRAPLEGHPWEAGFLLDRSPLGRLAGSAGRWSPDMELDWVPVRPERVCEVAYDQVDRRRFRHPARFRRWRPDREPRSCRFDQLEGSTDRPPLLAAP